MLDHYEYMQRHAVTVASGYTTINANNNPYIGLLPPKVVSPETITIPSYSDIKTQELNARTPLGASTITFNASSNPINNVNDWNNKFPQPGTSTNPKVVRVTGSGLNIPNGVNLSNYIITVDNGDINFNGNGNILDNVVLVTSNGNINLGKVQSNNLSVFASGAINMNGQARFGGKTLIANNSNNITFDGATKTTTNADAIKVISQGNITFNGALDTRGDFLSKGTFTANGNAFIFGSINAKQNIIFNGGAYVTAVSSNSAPTNLLLSNNTTPENVVANSLIGNFTSTDPDSGNTFTYSLVTGTGSTDNAAFTIINNELRIVNSPDFEAKNSYSIRVKTIDQGGLSFEKVFTVNINDVNEAPIALVLSDNTTSENVSANSLIGTFASTDPDTTPQTFTYSLVTGTGSTDNAVFTIANNELRIVNSPDFEAKNSYSIRVRTTDQGGLSFERVFTVGITDVNEAPTALVLSNNTTPENVAANSLIGTFTSTDPDTIPQTFTYSLVTGTGSTDNASFTIVNNELRIVNSPDFEVKNSYSIRVRTTDQGGLSFEKVFTVSITDVNEAPLALVLSNNTTPENVVANSLIGNFTSTDPDSGNTFTYSLVTGTGSIDNASFAIANNELRIVNPPDFEIKNSYSIRVRTTDQGGLSFEKVFTVSITDVNEAPIALVLSNNTTPENVAANSLIGNFTSTDPDSGNTFTYSLVTGTGSADNAAFTIVNNELRIVNSPDFEAKNSYSIRVRTTDQGGLSFEKVFTVSITDVNEAPIALVLSNNTTPENVAANSLIGNFTSTDPDSGNTFTYSLVTGTGSTDNASFAIANNELRIVNSPDFEAKSSYSIRVRTTDQGGLSYEKSFTVNITNVNEAPVFTSTPTNNGSQSYLYNIITTDPENDKRDITATNLPTWLTLTDNHDGTAKLIGTPSFTDSGIYNIQLKVTDIGGLSTFQTFNLDSSIQLTENSNFTTAKTKSLTLPTSPSILSFQLDSLLFDTTSQNQIKDSLEISLTDQNGNTLVHTIDNRKDVFFNISDGQTPVLGADTTYNPITKTVSVNLPAGTNGQIANLTIRLVNDDKDTNTTATIRNIQLQSGGSGISSVIIPNNISVNQPFTDFAGVTDVSLSILAQYQQTSFNSKTKTLYTDITLLNQGTYSISSPLLVSIGNISDPSVKVINTAGKTPDGIPFYNFSNLVNNQNLNPQQNTQLGTLAFYNPNQVQFTYDLQVLAGINRNPVITSTAPTESLIGKPYTYQVVATDPDQNPLTYILESGPTNASINSQTGLLTYTADATGTQSISIKVTDNQGGWATQTFNLNVMDGSLIPNRPPVITSNPEVSADITKLYTYQVKASDLDYDNLTYSIVKSPTGLSIDANTGLVSWQPKGTQMGIADVILQVTDGRGGVTQQKYQVSVGGEIAGNHAPIIISTPETAAFAATGYVSRVEAIDADNDKLTYKIVSAPDGVTIDANTGWITWTTKPTDVGTQQIKVSVDDGKGGIDIQSFSVDVSGVLPGQIWGRVYYDSDTPPQDLVDLLKQQPKVNQPKTGNRLDFPILTNDPATAAKYDGINLSTTLLPDLAPSAYQYFLSYSDAYNKLILSTTLPTNIGTNYRSLNSDGTTSELLSPNPGGTFLGGTRDGDRFGIVPKDYIGDFKTGDIFTVAPNLFNANIQKTTKNLDGTYTTTDFATLKAPILNPSTLRGKFDIVEQLLFDTTGNFGGDLIAKVSSADGSEGNIGQSIYRIKADGTVSTLATFNNILPNTPIPTIYPDSSLDMTLIPNESSYGVLSGKLLMQGIGNIIFTIDSSGKIQTYSFPPGGYDGTSPQSTNREYSLSGIAPVIIQPNSNAFGKFSVSGTFGSYFPNQVQVISADLLQPFVGDYLSQTNANYFYFDGTKFQFLFKSDIKGSDVNGNIQLGVSYATDNLVFAPVGLGNVPNVKPLSLANQIVFIDKNNNGIREADEVYTKTDDNGIYHFDVAAGSYRVVEELQPGFQITNPTNPNYRTVVVTPGKTNSGNNFGLIRNHAPVITSTPETTAYAATGYLTQIKATDADNDKLTYKIVAAPDGVTIDANTGWVTWTTKPTDVGTQQIKVSVDDGKGGIDTQSFSVDVSGVLPGQIWGRVYYDSDTPPQDLVDLLKQQPKVNQPKTGNRLDFPILTNNPTTAALFDGMNVSSTLLPDLTSRIYPYTLFYSDAYDKLIISAPINSTGTIADALGTDYRSINSDGTTSQFLSPNPAGSFLGGGSGQSTQIAIVPKDYIGDFKTGDIYTIASQYTYDPIKIQKTTKNLDGTYTTSIVAIIASNLANVIGINTSYAYASEFLFDTTGNFGGDLLVKVESNGIDNYRRSSILRVKADGNVSNLATFTDNGISFPLIYPFQGMALVPNESIYGDLAGKLILPGSGLKFTIDSSGTIQSYISPLSGYDGTFPQSSTRPDLIASTVGWNINGDSIPILPNSNAIGISQDTGGSSPNSPYQLQIIDADIFQPFVGDYLLPQGSYQYFDGTKNQTIFKSDIRPILANGDLNLGVSYSISNLVFAPTGLGNVPSVKPLSLANQIVFIDKNNNGIREADEVYTKTDDNGIYHFNVAAGSYRVVQELQPGFQITNPTNPNYRTVVVTPGKTNSGNNFGNIRAFIPPVVPPSNTAPEFLTTAPTAAQVGQTVLYRPKLQDAENDPITLEAVTLPNGMTFDKTRGLLAWKPSADQIGTQTGILKASDGRGGITLQSFSIEVPPLHLNPQFLVPPPALSEVGVGQTIEYDIRTFNTYGVSDPIFTLTTSLSSATLEKIPYYISFIPSGYLGQEQTFKFTPKATDLGLNTFTIGIDDKQGGTAKYTFQINVVASKPNNSPILNLDGASERTLLGLPYTANITATDPDNDKLTFSIVNAPSGLTIQSSLGNSARLFWQPTADQTGKFPITIKVDDNRGGVDIETYNLEVASSATVKNKPPFFASEPIVSGTVNSTYRYSVKVDDPNNDNLILTLNQAPDGLILDPVTKQLQWNPTSKDIGDHAVILQVVDSSGAIATQTYNLKIRALNLPPIITSSPITLAAANGIYQYRVLAQDPEGNPLNYFLDSSPSGMTIDNTGLISWSPTTATTANISIRVDDNQGGTTSQNYQIQVSATPINLPPAITSKPIYGASAGAKYTYQVTTSDPESASITYSLASAPSGMSIDNTGLISWNSSLAGTFPIEVVATDNQGQKATQKYSLEVITNLAPIVTSQPIVQAIAGQIYRYDVKATDPNNDPIGYELDAISKALGITIDSLGRIRWNPQIANIGNHAIAVKVSDNRGGVTTQAFNLSINADTEAPVVNLFVNQSVFNQNETATLVVNATDNVDVDSLSLNINGQNLLVDANGKTDFKLSNLGTYTGTAIAKDKAGNIGQAKVIFNAISPDVDAPTVTFAMKDGANTLIDGATITNAVDIYGTVADTNFQDYQIEVAPIGTEDFVLIGGGTTQVINGKLGTFDPSTLANDLYTVRVTAKDLTGKSTSWEQTVSVEGNLKLGNFTLSFTDLSIPISGIPINVTRTYDSLNAKVSDDFGYGWRLEFRDTDLRTSLAKDEVYEQTGLRTQAFKDGTKVFITLPGGKRETFTFKPTRDPISSYFPAIDGYDTSIYHPAFTSEKGSTSTLTVVDTKLSYIDGKYYSLGSGVAYNPADGYFGNKYILTTKEGIVYEIDGTTGDLNKVTNPNGNTLTFTDAGITASTALSTGSDTGKAVTFQRDASGRITSVTDPLGQVVKYQYDAKGDLIGVSDRENNTTQFKYAQPTRDHFLTEVVDPLGRSGVKNEYDAQGRLVKLVDALGNPVELAYDPTNSTETIKDALGNPTTYVYDQRGNVVSEVDALGGLISRTYDEQNNLLSETDAEGRTKSYTYDYSNNLLSQTDGLGNTSRYTYGANSKLLTSIDPLGNATKYTLDSKGNVLSKIDAEGNKTTYTYDFRGNAISIKDAKGGITSYGYDVFGNRIRMVDPLGNETTYTYDARGNQLTETFKITTSLGIRTLTTTKTFDGNNNTTSVTDAEGNISRFEYDPNNKQITTIDPLGRRTESRYDEKGELTSVIFSDGKSNSYTYDAKGNRISSTDREGRTSFISYDALGRATQLIAPDDTPNDLSDNPRKILTYDRAGWLKSIIDERGIKAEYTYDASGNITSVINSLGDTLINTYDPARHKISTTDALGRTTQFTYDGLGRQLDTILPDGTIARTVYDSLNNVTAKIDQAGKKIQYEYDVLNRLTAVIDPLNQRTSYAYDEVGNLTSQTDANNHITRYEYDGLRRRLAMVNPLGNRSEMSYDSVGNLVSIKDFNGNTTTYEYDSNNLLTAKHFADGTSTTFTYTSTGKRKSETDTRGTTLFTYDANDLLTSRIEPDGTTVSYTYKNGNITSVETPSGKTKYTYDVLGRLDTVTDATGDVTTYTYDKVGNLIETKLSNGVVETRQYDNMDRLSVFTNTTATGTVLSNYSYTFDPVGNIKTVDEFGGRKETYTYDDLYRLTQEAIIDPLTGNRTTDYTFDSVGNRLGRFDSLTGMTTYSYDTGDRLITETSASDITSYSYDKNGNTLLEFKSPNDQTTYA
ncbi:putative Ig domain-containing protein [Pseudanabaena sp. UWO310]|uniref:putative Ig domain-containing protein n=1 Tax=Pseudanabaena sp. UWO310 TaxID=2480795 RepID=UPI0011571888|nr:putative Ig domain-containing protein [Pseudanabaena sp. UWO310]TYQ27480.1 hypothetical protein PseudUWO310_15780 [Pseudanabaena sp. UWO310]